MPRKAPKAETAADCRTLEQLPNVGPAVAGDLRRIGIETPEALRGQDAMALYRRLCTVTGQRHDPCMLDTFMAAIDFMNGGASEPWWRFTTRRKALYGPL